MARKILIFSFVLISLLSVPVSVNAMETTSNAEEQIDELSINISVSQSTLYVTGASGMTLEVVSLTGRCITVVKIESPAQRVELNIPKGCYILKVGKVVRKVSIR